MKKLYSLVFTLSSIWAFGQGTPGIVNGSVVTASGNGVSNYPVHIIDSNSNGGINSSVLLTDVNGMFNDTLQLGAVGSLTISVFDSCSNTHQSASIPYSPNAIGGVIVVTQSFVICGSNSGSGGGNGGGTGWWFRWNNLRM